LTTKTEYIDNEGVTWGSYEDYVVTGLCGLCGCADSDIEEDLLAILRSPDGVIDIERDKYHELLLHVLDNADLLEHGTSIRYSWLNEKGREVRGKL
jgi:hypothetical protein